MEASGFVIDNMKTILFWFKAVIGLALNLQKTKIYKVGVCEGIEEEVSQ